MSERIDGRPLNVGVFGAGNIGNELISQLEAGEEGFRIRRVAVLRRGVERKFQTPYTHDVMDIIKDPNIDMVFELMGGEGAEKPIIDAIDSGKSLVTANKAVLAKSAKTIFDAARSREKDVGFEASVGGKIPIMALLRYFDGEEILSIDAGPNGTTMFIFTMMAEYGMDYESALKLAQEKKFAEPDPSRDVGGLDARDKVVLLASLAWNTQFDPNRVTPTGIEGVTLDDMEIAGWLGTMRRRGGKRGPGYAIKPLAIARKSNGSVEISVSPALVRKDNALANVRNEQNVFTIATRNGTPITIQGPGAGPKATTSALLADARRIARNMRKGTIDELPTLDGDVPMLDPRNAKSQWYIRLNLKDVSGSLRAFGEIFERYNLSAQHSIQDEAPEEIEVFKSDFVTLHSAEREQVMNAVRDLEQNDRVNGTPFVLPIWG